MAKKVLGVNRILKENKGTDPLDSRYLVDVTCHISLTLLSAVHLLYNFSLVSYVEYVVSLSKNLPAAFARPKIHNCRVDTDAVTY